MKSMKDLKYEKIKLSLNGSISDIAFDGKYYYFLTVNSNRVIKTDKHYKIVQCYMLDKVYSYISYDSRDRTFFMYSKECTNTIYVYNCNFMQIDCYHIYRDYECYGDITGISYDCYEDKLMISFEGAIGTVDKICHIINIKYESRNICITAVMSLAVGYLAVAMKNNRKYILIFDEYSKIISYYCVSSYFCIKTMIFNPCIPCQDKAVIEFYAIKDYYSFYVCKIKVGSCELGYRISRCNYSICNRSCDDVYCDYDRDEYDCSDNFIDDEFIGCNNNKYDCDNSTGLVDVGKSSNKQYISYNNRYNNNCNNDNNSCYNSNDKNKYKNKCKKSASKYSDKSYGDYFFGESNINNYKKRYRDRNRNNNIYFNKY